MARVGLKTATHKLIIQSVKPLIKWVGLWVRKRQTLNDSYFLKNDTVFEIKQKTKKHTKKTSISAVLQENRTSAFYFLD